ncbi:uncharacterized protein [Henckelia pumila]|uniref:uncharacterized protein n=1 Tax=Henckelia pumila TaxID=405737 RepID=UPI003C6E8A9B
MVRPEGEEPFWFETTRGSRRTHIISFMQAKQLVHDGCEAFLASIPLIELPAHHDISVVDVVRDFEDVFPVDVAGIPPDREVELFIDLVPDIVPISKEPYRLAPTEMKELKEQIQEFLDKDSYALGREEHSQHLKIVLEVLRERKLFAKFEKCEFWLDRVEFLGHIIFKSGVEVDPSKVQAVKEWSIPRNSSEIRSFLGLAGYYRKFIKGFSSILVPLTALTKKNAKFIWKPECQKSFDVLKEALTTVLVLAMPQGEGDFVVYIDASKLGLGAVLMQQDRVKAEHQRPARLVKPLSITEWKWENITMDFVVGFSRIVRGLNAIWVIVDRLTNLAHFLPVRTDFSMTQYAKLYIREIVRLHGIPVSIVSDRDPWFTSYFWKSLHSALGTKLLFSTAFHPKMDGQSERVIQILEDLLRACVIEFHDSWESRLPLVEFAYNNSYQATIGMTPYEALYGRPCRSPVLWTEIGERSELGPEIFQQTAVVVAKIRDRMRTTQSKQKSYADHRRRDLEFSVGDHVFIRVAPMKGVMRFGKKWKLAPRFIGPFEILDRVGALAYRVALPPNLDGVHNVFHVSMLRKYVLNPSHVLSMEPLQLSPHMTYEEMPIQILDRQERRLRNKWIPMIKVRWQNHSEEEATWEADADIRTHYPELFGRS